MQRKVRRPALCEPGAMAGNTKNMGERLRLSRERLLASDLKQNTRAWRLWAVCVEATVGYTREADQTYVVGLARRAAMERQVASQLLQRFNDLGVFAWRSGPRGSHTPGMLSLPTLSGGHSDTVSEASRGQSGTMSPTAQGVTVAPLHNNELSNEALDGDLPFGAGTQHSPLIGPSDGVEMSGDWHAERRAMHEARPEPWNELDAAIQAAYATEPEATLAERFPPFHDDERTGDTTGDDEASQLRWQSANPSKVRARRRRE